MNLSIVIAITSAVVVIGCAGPAGPAGEKGEPGAPGQTGPAGESAVAGSRLKPRLFQGSDGSKGLIGWYDSELDFDCEFQRLGKETFCLPVGYVMPVTQYTDAACSEPVLRVDLKPIPNNPNYYLQPVGEHAGVYKDTGMPHVGTTYSLKDGQCVMGATCLADGSQCRELKDVAGMLASGSESGS